MSGKGSGKKHNRAAQSDQHGFQGNPTEVARKPLVGEAGGASLEKKVEKLRVLEKMRELENHNREGNSSKK